MPRTKKINWENFGEYIVDKVLEALDYWCWNISGDPVEECYAAHMDLDLYTLAEEFANWVSGITDKDLELLKKMPDDIYDKFDAKARREIERVVREFEREE